MTERDLVGFRAAGVGSLIQGAGRNLLPHTTAAQNVSFARLGLRRSQRRSLMPARDLLDLVGAATSPGVGSRELSGGEQQRIALAVAVANQPGLLLADEPTSQLGLEHRESMVDTLNQVNEVLGATVIVVTHDPVVAARLGRTVTIRDGRVGAMGHESSDFAVVARRRQHPAAAVGPQALAGRDAAGLRGRRRPSCGCGSATRDGPGR